MRRGEEYIAHEIDGETLFLETLERPCTLLFIYGKDVEREHAYLTFLANGLAQGEFCVYAYPKAKAKIHPELAFGDAPSEMLTLLAFEEGVIRMRHVDEAYVTECVKKVARAVGDVLQKASAEKREVRVLVDWGDAIRKKEAEFFVANLPREHENVLAVHAFSAEALGRDGIPALLKRYERVVIATRAERTTALPGFTLGRAHAQERAPEVLSQKTLENFVKMALDAVVLALLRKKPMSGFHIIKAMERAFHITLSHGTIYPLLHTLMSDGLVSSETGSDMKSKIYKLTGSGERWLADKLEDLARTHAHLLNQLGL